MQKNHYYYNHHYFLYFICSTPGDPTHQVAEKTYYTLVQFSNVSLTYSSIPTISAWMSQEGIQFFRVLLFSWFLSKLAVRVKGREVYRLTFSCTKNWLLVLFDHYSAFVYLHFSLAHVAEA